MVHRLSWTSTTPSCCLIQAVIGERTIASHVSLRTSLDFSTLVNRLILSTVLDVCRLLCATSSAIASYRAVGGDTVIERLMDACEWELAWEPSRARQNNTMLVVRGLANLTATESGCKVLLSHNAANVKLLLQAFELITNHW
jgi:hypothetical protein